MTDLSSAAESAPPRTTVARLVRRPVVWIYAALVAGGLVVIVPRLASMLEQPDLMLVAWIGGLLQAITLLLFGWLMLPRRRARATSVLLSILIGATFCTAAAILLVNAGAAMQLERFVVTPIIEEVVKIAAVVVVLFMLRPRLRGPLDGLIIGYFVAFGFTTVENMLYTYEGESVALAWQLVISRLIFQLGSHVLWTGIAGAAVAYVILQGGRRWWIAAAAFAGVLVLHLLWDLTLLVLPPILYLGVVALIAAAGIVAFVLVRRAGVAFEAATATTALHPLQVSAPNNS